MIAIDVVDTNSVQLQLGLCYASAAQMEIVDGLAPDGGKIEHFQKLFDKLVKDEIGRIDFATGKGYATGLIEATSLDRSTPANVVGEVLYKALDCDHRFKE